MSRTIYVGNLPLDVKERELDDVFYKCGRIVDIDMKMPPRPPGFAFIEFESSYDADEAVKRRDGYDFDGYRLRVEIARGRGGGRDRDRGGRGGRGGGRGKAGPRRMDLCVEVENLPERCSWQDLKDFMRKAGEVVFADVWTTKRGGLMGIVEFTNRDDMTYCLDKMHDTEFKNPFDTTHIKIFPYEDEAPKSPRSRSRSRSRTPPRRDSRSRSRSPARPAEGATTAEEAKPTEGDAANAGEAAKEAEAGNAAEAAAAPEAEKEALVCPPVPAAAEEPPAAAETQAAAAEEPQPEAAA
mmetsp:Transcript_19241/g.40359  ORF Transcript_19241/g.40359 Transcript_19241/m.40359 type:complete len:297 (-) Transcript_19241:215-1105(-)